MFLELNFIIEAKINILIDILSSDVTENTYVLLLEWRCKGACSKVKFHHCHHHYHN